MGRPMVPDLVGAANTQGDLNRNAALDVANQNRYRQVGPEGSSNQWITDPTTGQVTNQTTMGTRPEAMYNALMDNGQSNLASFQNQYWGSGAGGGGAGGGGGGGYNFDMGGGGGGGVGPGANIPGTIQTDLDYSHLSAMPGEDIGAARQQAQDALYARSAGYLDPQYKQSDEALRTRLSNQGLVPGSEQYNRAYANAESAKERAYTGARQDAIAGGGAEAARAQEMALQLRNQGITEAGNLGAFHNLAQGQGADQFLTARGQDVDMRGQDKSLAGTLGAAGISAGASNYRSDQANALDTRKQQYLEALGMGEEANQFLPKFGIDQGNVGKYNAADVYGATQDQFTDAMDRYSKKKPGLVKSLLPVAGTIAASAVRGK